MMNQPINIIREITLGDFVALYNGWQEAHKKEDDMAPPTAEEWEREQLRILQTPHLTGAGNC
jgi:hypothetical protein